MSVDAEGPAPVHVKFGEEREAFFAEELQAVWVERIHAAALDDSMRPLHEGPLLDCAFCVPIIEARRKAATEEARRIAD